VPITAENLGILYSEEKGYGFLVEKSRIINGRSESYTYVVSGYVTGL